MKRWIMGVNPENVPFEAIVNVDFGLKKTYLFSELKVLTAMILSYLSPKLR